MDSSKLVKYKYGASWQLIFFHNSTGRVLFTKDSPDLLICNKTQQFSTLGTLTDNYKINGYFEFLLEYPEFNYLIHWRQKKNPIKSESNIGFIPLHVPDNPCPFNGLAITRSKTYTFLDGNVGSTVWHYAIGSYGTWGGSESIPGPYLLDENKKELGSKIVNLYVRIRTSISCKINKKAPIKEFLLIALFVS